jgi:hypothetical protein
VTRPDPRPGLAPTIYIEIPTCWTPEQAAAVFELIDEIRDRIWTAYGPAIQEEIQRQIRPTDR